MDDKIKKPSITEKFKEGVSVQEIESFARKYTTEAFLILSVIIATISSTFSFFTGAGWSLVLGGLGTIVSIALPDAIHKIEKIFFSFAAKQEKPVQIVIGVVQIILALFVPLVIFAQIGLLAGLSFHHFLRQPKAVEEKGKKSSKTESEEEHY